MSLASVTTTVLAASTVQSVGAVLAVVTMLGFIAYVIANVRSGRDEAGSEIELAPNRKPYYDDEELETTKLNRTLASGVVLLGIVSVGLPLYWLAEPGRQEGNIEESLRIFESRGHEQYEVGSQCVNCHGPEGTGGQAPYVLLDADSQFVANLQWRAPALDTVLMRFSREELAGIIDFGRPGTPMPAWGADGGGPRTVQEISNIVDYLASIQLSSDESKEAVAAELVAELNLLEGDDLQDPEKVAEAAELIDYEDGSGGGLAYPLDTLVPRKFATVDELAEFLGTGSVNGLGYGIGGQGSGRMPGFLDNPNTEDVADDGMYTQEMVCAVARYASTLQGDQPPLPEVPPTTVAPPTTTTTVAGGDDEAAAGEGEEEEAPPTPAFCSDEALNP